MVTTISMAEIGALVGDPARAAMLQALMEGRALTATELAHVAGITPQTASGHLSRLAAASLIAVAKQGRHRYHRLATVQVARLLEGMMLVAADAAKPMKRIGPRDEQLRLARRCYDHVAGWLGVSLADSMARQGWIEIEEDSALVTADGLRQLASAGIELDEVMTTAARARPVCRPCLDWSERRPHLAGRLGAAVCTHGLKENWIRTRADSRALDVTPKGWIELRRLFGIEQPRVSR